MNIIRNTVTLTLLATVLATGSTITAAEVDVERVTLTDGRTLEGIVERADRPNRFNVRLYMDGREMGAVTVHQLDIKQRRKITQTLVSREAAADDKDDNQNEAKQRLAPAPRGVIAEALCIPQEMLDRSPMADELREGFAEAAEARRKLDRARKASGAIQRRLYEQLDQANHDCLQYWLDVPAEKLEPFSDKELSAAGDSAREVAAVVGSADALEHWLGVIRELREEGKLSPRAMGSQSWAANENWRHIATIHRLISTDAGARLMAVRDMAPPAFFDGGKMSFAIAALVEQSAD